MKYYILDLSAKNSLVRYLVSQGHTVFMVSWKNPNASDRGLGMDDYLRLGIRATRRCRVAHRAGPKNSFGGLLHRRHVAVDRRRALGRRRRSEAGDPDAAGAHRQDFSEPGELSVFISPSQLDMLEAVMDRTGVLKSEQMGGAHSRCCARAICCGRRPSITTCAANANRRMISMAWNADGTRMPSRMHAEYLRRSISTTHWPAASLRPRAEPSILQPSGHPCSSSARKPITSRRGNRCIRRAA